jgi:opacity protein-like surface antigen
MMTRIARPLIVACAVVLGISTPVWAQRRVPHADSGGIGGDVGVFLPRQSGMTTGPALEGFYERYLTSRDSIRIGAGWANPKFDRETSDSMRQIRLAFDVAHNWEGGAVHPFVGAGLGTYFLQQKDNGQNFGDSQTKFGGTIFGGVEYFTSRTFSVRGEARYHAVMKASGYDPSGLALSVGVKTYF